MLCQWFYLWKLVINALFWMYRAWQDATHALMPISLFAGSFYTVFHARASTTDRLITVTYRPILNKRVSLSLVATSSRHLVYVTVISSYELVHWDNRIALCTILTKNSFFTLDPRWLRQTLHSTQRLCMSNMRENCWKLTIVHRIRSERF